MSVHAQFAKTLGKLVKHQRAQSMAQDELATRTGFSRNTISVIENGKSVSTEALFTVLAHLNLPLSDQLFTTYGSKGLFGVLSDAGADAWGQRVILSLHKTKPANALQFLLAGSGMGVGALVFNVLLGNTDDHSRNFRLNRLNRLNPMLSTR